MRCRGFAFVFAGVLALACTPSATTSCEPPSNSLYMIAAARWEPRYDVDGTMLGVGISHIEAGSFPACLGLRDGDLLLEFEGEPIRDPRFFERFGKQQQFTLLVQDAAGAKRKIENE